MSITIQQEGIYMKARGDGQSQPTASAKSGFSESTGRRIEKGKCCPRKKRERHWRTRKDPLEKVWASELVPLLQRVPELQPITLLEHLQEQDALAYPDALLRTLQRRTKQWKGLYGAEQEVMFRQSYPPGMMGLSDFTQLKKITISLAGEPFKHLLYHFRLAYSGWQYVKALPGGESFDALVQGLQGGLNQLGGCPYEHRTDSLSAAFKNIKAKQEDDLTNRYEQLCQHYQMKPTRNNRGKGHENGAIEAPHGHVKNRIKQALLKRGSTDFPTLAAYQTFLHQVVEALNRRYAKRLAEEKLTLQPLPATDVCDYTVLSAVVTSGSTINVRLSLYTVPARLVGQRLTVHLFVDRLALYLGSEYATTLTRVYPAPGKRRARRIDYRHIIESLSRKPRAFLYSQLRDDLLPNDTYKQLWHWAMATLLPHQASHWMVGVLAIAARTSKETGLGEVITRYYQQHQALPKLLGLQQQFEPISLVTPSVKCAQHALADYDQLLKQEAQA